MSELRPTLGDFNSVVCFKAVITGIETPSAPTAPPWSLPALVRCAATTSPVNSA